MDKIIQKCFKKIRVKGKKDEVKEALYKKQRNLKNKTDEKSKDELKQVEFEMAEKHEKEYFEKITERTGHSDCQDGSIKTSSLWNL